jgi:hypothetical protein
MYRVSVGHRRYARYVIWTSKGIRGCSTLRVCSEDRHPSIGVTKGWTETWQQRIERTSGVQKRSAAGPHVIKSKHAER